MSKIKGLKIVEDDWHFQDRKRKGLVKDDSDAWRFIFEHMVDDYHMLNGVFLFKCEGFGTGVRELIRYTLNKFGPQAVVGLSNRVMINEIVEWQINDITNWIEVFEEEFNKKYITQIDKSFEFNYNNIIQGDARMVKFPLEPDVILENPVYGSKGTTRIDGKEHKNTEDAFAHDSIKLLKGVKGRIYISIRPSTLNNLEKSRDIREIYKNNLSDLVKGNNKWFEGVPATRLIILKYIEGYNNPEYTLWEVPDGLPPYNNISKKKFRYTDTSRKIITGYSDAENEIDGDITSKIKSFKTKWKDKGYQQPGVNIGYGTRLNKSGLKKTDKLLMVKDKTSQYSEPVIAGMSDVENKPLVEYREPLKKPDLEKPKVIVPCLMNEGVRRAVRWVVIDKEGTIGSSKNVLHIHGNVDTPFDDIAKTVVGDPFNIAYSLVRVGTTFSANIFKNMPYILSDDIEVWADELGLDPYEENRFRDLCNDSKFKEQKKDNPIYDYS